MTKVIGLTGGIGSGKTLVANYLQSLGYPVYIADDEAKKIMNTNEVVQAVSLTFGKEIIENDTIDREKLSKLVFNNPDKLKKLNAIVHPLVKNDFDEWLKNHNNFPFVFKEAAILFESGSYKFCYAVITVTSPLETRLQRVIERDKTDRESVLKRIQNQWSDEQRIAKSNFVIHNISVKETYKQTDEILKILTNQ
ncbi:MAG TPA: dephospho-CoA kinase [Flavobacterium sp.]|uniref:dephospho-CoA kinase n=1 Tax=Flavobacterium sp. TaxID=239 RepID=UPI002CB5F10D|nr:dephospho-CoA kinase [Flavobacterium sp.]HNP32612.1 dephospho-CoA kinase [Flavobacterium sp.]